MKRLIGALTLLLAGCMTPVQEGRVIEYGNHGSIHGYRIASLAENGVWREEVRDHETLTGPRISHAQAEPGTFAQLVPLARARRAELERISHAQEGQEPCLDYGRDYLRIPSEGIDIALGCPDQVMLNFMVEIDRLIGVTEG